jgi:hypothetical protein
MKSILRQIRLSVRALYKFSQTGLDGRAGEEIAKELYLAQELFVRHRLYELLGRRRRSPIKLGGLGGG